ncbi:hypothetical protein B0H10DRAFT_1961030 [Mycena sp. CBHHK59/15]|nr:hypothetical protein B0H10DRAFT_1961030 [Mycena sp. CBHHK59/15]
MPPRRGGVPAPAQPLHLKNRPAQLDARLPLWLPTTSQPLLQQEVMCAPPGWRAQHQPATRRSPALGPGPGALEPARGFAPLTAASSSRQQTPRTPVRSTTNSPLQFPPQTPGRNAANRLLTQLNHQTQMASPGPPVRNFSDDSSPSSSESDPLPVPQPRRVVRARIQPSQLCTPTQRKSPQPTIGPPALGSGLLFQAATWFTGFLSKRGKPVRCLDWIPKLIKRSMHGPGRYT